MEEFPQVDELLRDDHPADAGLDRRMRRVARLFLQQLGERHGAVRALVYGSRVRGTARQDSDLDLAVILTGAPGDRWMLAGQMARVAFDVLLMTGVLVDPLPIWEAELVESGSFKNPALLRVILREGVPP